MVTQWHIFHFASTPKLESVQLMIALNLSTLADSVPPMTGDFKLGAHSPQKGGG